MIHRIRAHSFKLNPFIFCSSSYKKFLKYEQKKENGNRKSGTWFRLYSLSIKMLSFYFPKLMPQNALCPCQYHVFSYILIIPVSAVIRIVPVVTHDKITAFRDYIRTRVIRELRHKIISQFFPVHINHTVSDFYRFSSRPITRFTKYWDGSSG